MHEALEGLLSLHAAVDRESALLAERHRDRLACGLGCIGCCRDDITVFTVEAERILRHAGALLEAAGAHEMGACAMLGARGECRIYENRPYVCRTQGLPIRWIDEEALAEYRDICPLNENGEPLESLDEDACWTIGPAEERLRDLQLAFSGSFDRVPLRQLFRRR
jgi:Uncharacterised protein family (UPF0153).